MSDAGVFRCPSCGAPNAVTASACAYCRAELHPVRCPWCFEWADARSGPCPRCGSTAVPPPAPDKALACPQCRKDAAALSTRALGGARLAGCGRCGGVWTDPESFRRLCEDRDTQAAYAGLGLAASPRQFDPTSSPVLYRPCPACAEMMNRLNFASMSGVILDVCRPHGVWFDADELRRVMEFIRGGGLEAARERQKREMDLEAARLEDARADAKLRSLSLGAQGEDSVELHHLLDFMVGGPP